MNAKELITEHLDLWTSAVTAKSTAGRGRNGKIELTGIKKLRELILELAVRGKLVDQDPTDEPASMLLERIAEEKARLVKEGKIKKPKKVAKIQENQKPHVLPKGWAWVQLAAIGQIIGGGTPKSQEPAFWSAEGIKWLTPADLYGFREKYIYSGKRDITRAGLDSSSSKLMPAGTVLFSSRAPIGYVAIAGCELATNQGFKSCAPYMQGMSEYLFYFLKRSAKLIDDAASGTTFKEISGSKIAEFLVALPPLNEQHRIVEKIDELMALCDRLEQQVGDQLEAHEVLVDTLLDALTRSADATEVAEEWTRIAEQFDTLFTTEASIDKLQQTILQLAVMGQLVEQDPNDESASVLLERIAEEKARLVKKGDIKKPRKLPEIVEEQKLFKLPEGWEWARIWDISELITSGSRDWAKYYSDDGAIFITMGNLSRGDYQLRLENIRHVSPPSGGEGARTSLQAGDLVVSITGDVGNLGLIPEGFGEAYINQHSCLVRFSSLCRNRYHAEFLRSPSAKTQFDEPQRGVKNSFRLSDMGDMLVPLPPESEQHRIIEKVDELMALCNQLKGRLGEAGETRTHLAEAVVEMAVN